MMMVLLLKYMYFHVVHLLDLNNLTISYIIQPKAFKTENDSLILTLLYCLIEEEVIGCISSEILQWNRQRLLSK